MAQQREIITQSAAVTRSLPISMFKAIMTSPAGTVCPWSGRSQWCRGVTATAWWRPIAAGRSRCTSTAATSIVDKALTLAFCIVTPLKHIQPRGLVVGIPYQHRSFCCLPQILVFQTGRAQTISIAVIMTASQSTMYRQQVEAAAAASLTHSAYNKQLHICWQADDNYSTPIHDGRSDGAENTLHKRPPAISYQQQPDARCLQWKRPHECLKYAKLHLLQGVCLSIYFMEKTSRSSDDDNVSHVDVSRCYPHVHWCGVP